MAKPKNILLSRHYLQTIAGFGVDNHVRVISEVKLDLHMHNLK